METNLEVQNPEDLAPNEDSLMLETLEGYPLSPQQRRLWNLHAAHSKKIPFLTFEITLEGALEMAKIHAALLELGRRHEILYTAIRLAPGLSLPLQVLEEATPEIRQLDLDQLDGPALSEAIQKARGDLERPLDPERGPLWRALVIREAPERHRLLLAMSALVADGGSGRVLLEALAEVLEGEEADEDLLQYAQFCDWQRELLEGEEGEEVLEFWQRQHLAELEFPEVPGARRRPDPSTASTARQRLEISLEGVALDAFESDDEEEEGLEALLLAAWQVVLAIYSGSEDFALGVVVDGRKYSELDGMPGPFARVVPLRSRVAVERPLSRIAEKLARDLEEAQDWLEGYLHDEEAQEPPPFTVGFESLDLEQRVIEGGPTLVLDQVLGAIESFDLELQCRRGPEGWRAVLDYDPGVFDAAAVARLARSWTSLLQDAAGSPQQAAGRLQWLAEEDRLASVARGTERDGAPQLVSQRFAAQALKTPEALAVVEGERQITYAELATRSRDLACLLKERGVGIEQTVGLFMDRRIELVVGILGVLEAGAAYVPLDPAYPAERLAYMAEDSGLQLILTLEDHLASWELPQEALALDALPEQARSEGETSALSSGAHTPQAPNQLAYVLYTSGSTGRPKGVLISHGSLAAYVDTVLGNYGLGESQGVPIHSSFSFDLTVTSLFPPLLSGRSLVLAPRGQQVEALAGVLAEHEDLAWIKLTPGHARVLARQVEEGRLGSVSRALILGGEALRSIDVEAWQSEAPDTRLLNEYGPTEATVGCCLYEVGTSSWEEECETLPIGRPTAGVELLVLDPSLGVIPYGRAGELFIAGHGLARGYRGQPALTAERFIPHPLAERPGERVYRTGDLARFLPDGELLFLGRQDQQIKVRGFRIEPAEIETTLSRHPAVGDVAVIADGEAGEERLIAYLVPAGEDESEPQVSELREFLARTLPEYMVPALFVRLDELPLNAHGKLDRGALPAPEASAVTNAYSAPRTVEEEILVGIWAQVLGLERIGIDDDFFALGGDSIRSIPVVSLAQKQGLPLSLEILFAERTVRKVARVLGEAALDEAGEDEAIEPFAMVPPEDRPLLTEELEDAYPLSRLQAGMIFHLAANPSASLYHDVFSYCLKARLEVEALRIAVARLVASHPTLRTSFELDRFSEPLQRVFGVGNLATEAALPLTVHDMRHLDPVAQREVPTAFIAEERARGFDPRHLPLLRFTVHLWSEESFQFTVSFHHAILDGWSDASMLIELGISYISLLREQEPPFEPPVTRHRDFVALERQALADPETEAFWRELLHQVPAAPLPRPENIGDEESTAPIWAHVPVSRELSTDLEAVARRAAVPLKSVLLAAHLRALAFLTGEPDVLTCVTSNGRPERRDGERVLGLFLNSMPFRIRLEGGSWQELVQQVFDLERRSLPHRRYPMAELQRWHADKNLLESSFYFTHYHIVHQLDEFPEVEVENIEFHEATSFPLVANFHVDPFIDQIRVELTLARRLFDTATGDFMARVYAQVLEAIARGGEGRYEHLDLLSGVERQALLVDWNAAPYPEVEDLRVHRRILEQAARTPEAEAVRGGEVRWTWQELERRVRRLANRLVQEGVGQETVVAVCLERSPELVAVLLAILEAGAAYLPLELDAPVQRTAFLLSDAGASLVITRSSVASFQEELPAATRFFDLDHEELAEGESVPAFRPAPPEEALAYIIYTSGSTGRPKGVGVSHRAFAGYVTWGAQTYGEAVGGSLVHSSVAFDLTVTALFVPLFLGRSITLTPSGDGVGPLVTALEQASDLSFVKLTPSHARLLGTQLGESAADKSQALILGGEALRGDDLAFWRRQAPQTLIYNEYGPTEAVVGCSMAAMPAGDLDEGAVSIGRPARGARLYLLDPFAQPAAPGVPAEIWIGGGLARGYLGRPDLTADRFRPDPFAGNDGSSGGERLYRSGDLARFTPEGQLEYLGRSDQQVKIRGYRVEPEEVASAVRTHPAISDAVVVVDDESTDSRLVAYVVQREGSALPSVEEWRSFLASHLPDYMLPSRFQALAAIPLTINGKLDRARLPRPEDERPHLATTYTPPETPEEEVLVALWARVLGVDRVGIDDDYFALGGDSIRSLQLVAAARERGLVLSMELLFEHPTIRRLAAVLDGERDVDDYEVPESFALISTADRQRLPLAGGELVDAYPLTRLQAGMLYHRELDPEAALYHNVNQFEIEAPFDAGCLRWALRQLVAKHPALRTRFVTSGFSEPLALVEKEVEPLLTLVDLRHLEDEPQRTALFEGARHEHRRGFEVSEVPLVRFTVYRTQERRFILSSSFHHAIFDGWSNVTLLTELALTYSALLSGEAPAPTTDAASGASREYVALERRALESAESREFWRERVMGGRSQRLPRERLDAKERSGLGRLAVEQEFPDELSQGLRAVATALALPLKSVLLAAHLRILTWLFDDTEVLTCLISSGRPESPGSQASMGLFLNSLPLRLAMDPAGSESWSELIQRVFAAERQLLPHRRFPMAEMQRWREGQPLSETSFNFTHYHILGRLDACPDLSLRGTRSYEKTSFPLAASFHLDPFTSRLRFHLNGNREHFSAERLERYAGYYRKALEALAQDRTQSFGSAALLSSEEETQLIQGWNRAGLEAVSSPDQPFHRLFEAQVARNPGASALCFTADGQTLTYEELNRRADGLAVELRRRGVGAETVVALDLEVSTEWLVALLAVLKAGGAFLPLDSRWPVARRRALVDHAGAVLVVTDRDSSAHQRPEGPSVLALEGLLERDPDADSEETPPFAHEAAPDHLAYLVYTSGSTGRPKGVAVGQRQLSQYVQAVSQRLDLASCQRFALVSTVAADLGHTLLFGALANGGCLYLVPSDVVTDPRALGEKLHQHSIEALKIVPSHLSALLAAAEEPERLLPSDLLILGGEAAGPDLLRSVLELRPEMRLVNHYGPTETTVGVAAGEMDAAEDFPLPIGGPLPGARLYVLDHHLALRPAGALGELFIGGLSLARGYHQAAASTAESFLPDPFAESPGQRLYRSGDLARHRRDGRLELLGRRDHQVKVRGFRIELSEVEAALLAIDGVSQAVAQVDLEGEPTLVAHVSPASEGVDAAFLRDSLRRSLPDAMVPSYFALSEVGESLPLTANGKVDRAALARRPLLHEDAESEVLGDEIPHSPIEEILTALWADVLGLRRVGRLADFFALGGHSLLALRLVARLRADLAVEVALYELFEQSTPAAMAQLIEGRLRAGTSELRPIEKAPRDQPLPLSFPQQRLWFLDQLAPDNAFYNVPAAVRLHGPLNAAALEGCLNELVRRHEPLRTSFPSRGGQPIQVIAAPQPLHLPRIDLSGLSKTKAEDVAQRLATLEARRPFRLSNGPLMRAVLIELGREEHVALFTLHHIISDGWSTSLLIREVATLYRAMLEGRSPGLPELPVQYADFAAWQRRWMGEDLLEEQLNHWRRYLAGAPLVFDLPTDRPRPAVESFRGDVRHCLLPASFGQRLQALCRDLGGTAFMVSLAVFEVILARLSGQEDFLIGTPVANRTRSELESLIGFFVNELVLRSDLRQQDDPSFQTLLQRVRTTALEAMVHGDLPFERLVQDLRPERDLSRNPLFQVALVYNETLPALELPGLVLEVEGGNSQTSKMDLSLFLRGAPDGRLSLSLEYNSDLFDATTSERLLRHFQSLLEAVLEHPERRLSELQAHSVAERHQMLHEWNDEGQAVPAITIPERFAAQVRRRGEGKAILHGEREVSYATLDRMAAPMAILLKERLVEREARVAVCLERSPELVASLLAILAAGGAFVALDPKHPVERRAAILADSGARLLLTDRIVAEEMQTSLDEAGGEVKLMLLEDVPAVESLGLSELPSPAEPDDLAYLIYTSGSTGRPKGVMVRHHGVISLVGWQRECYGVEDETRVSQMASYSFDGAIGETFMALLNGAVLVILTEEDTEPARLPLALKEQGIDMAVVVPSVIAEADPGALPEGSDLILVAVGEVCTPELARRWARHCRLMNGYGPTENTVYSHLWTGSTEALESHGRVPVGRPIHNTKGYVLDRQLRPVPIGGVGELYLAGIGLARGYLSRPTITAERFLPDPFDRSEERVEPMVFDGGSLESAALRSRIQELVERKPVDRLKKPRPDTRRTPQEIREALSGLDSDLREAVEGFVLGCKESSPLYEAFCRYLAEAENGTYAASMIDPQTLLTLLGVSDLEGWRGVDFCCGNSEVLESLRSLGAEVMGLDLNPLFVQKARRRGFQAEMVRLDVPRETFFETTGLTPASLDFVTFTLGLDRVARPRQLLKNIFSVLRPGGRFAIQTLLPIVPEDDGDAERTIVYTPEPHRLTPGDTVTEDRRLLAAELLRLGAGPLTIYHLPYAVASGDGVQEYVVWSFTGERRVEDTGVTGQRMYRTGDRVRLLSDGQLDFLGRVDRQVKVRGQRIELGEIEATLAAHPEVRQCAVEALEIAGETRLAAYVVPAREGSKTSRRPGEEKGRVERWREVHDEIYGGSDTRHADRSPLTGWNSSYTGEPLSPEEMEQWVDQKVEAISALAPRRILEIGCGTGLLVERLAPDCEVYLATDLSGVAVKGLNQRVQELGLEQLEVRQQAAHDGTDLEEAAFDVVVLNSVIQYFPSAEYLCDVLEIGLRALRPGGTIFLGDVRNLVLEEAFLLSVELEHDPGFTTSPEALRHRVLNKSEHEEELLLAPAFFTALKERLPDLGEVRVVLHPGSPANELGRFRYDVLLERRDSVEQEETFEAVDWLSWPNQGWTLERVRQHLMENKASLALAAIPNARVAMEAALCRSLATGEFDGELETLVAQARQESLAAVDPEILYGLAAETERRLEISWARGATDGSFDALFTSQDSPPTPGWAFAADSPEFSESKAFSKLSNHPLESLGLSARLRRHLAARLTAAMVPAYWQEMQALPRNAAGKLDRRALPHPTVGREALGTTYVAPRTALEEELTAIWSEVLELKSVGVRDDFFEAGGHSLNATRILARIRETLGQSLPLTTLFQAPTVEQLAARLLLDEAPGDRESLVAVQPKGERPPFFCVSAYSTDALSYAPLARHLGEDQPFYLLRIPSLETYENLNSMEEMARHHLEQIRLVQPEGPYHLGGWSLGGWIALEMAQALSDQGDEAATLALFDCHAPSADGREEPASSDTILRLFATELWGLHRPDDLPEPPDLSGQSEEQALQTLARALGGEETEEEELARVRGLFERVRALYRPTPRTYEGSVHLFCSAETAEKRGPDLGWGDWVWGLFRSEVVSGDHYSMLHGDHGAALALRLAALLSDHTERS